MTTEELAKAIADGTQVLDHEDPKCFIGIVVMDSSGYATQTLYHKEECQVVDVMRAKVWPALVASIRQELGAELEPPIPVQVPS